MHPTTAGLLPLLLLSLSLACSSSLPIHICLFIFSTTPSHSPFFRLLSFVLWSSLDLNNPSSSPPVFIDLSPSPLAVLMNFTLYMNSHRSPGSESEPPSLLHLPSLCPTMRFLALPALWVALLVPGAASFSLAPLVPASPILAPRTLLAARHAPPTASEPQRNLPFFLDIETKGGIVFWSIVGIVAPFIVYNFLQDQLGLDVVRCRWREHPVTRCVTRHRLRKR